MHRILRYLGWGIAAVVVLVILVIVGVLIFSRTQRFNDLVQARLEPLLAETFKGQMHIGSIQGSLWGSLTLRDITVENNGELIARVPRAVVSVSLIPLLWQKLDLNVAAYDLAANLIREPNGQWNVLEAFADKHPSNQPPSASNFAIALSNLIISNGNFEIAPQGANGLHYRLLGLDLQSNASFGAGKTSFAIESLRVKAAAPSLPPVQLASTLTFNQDRGAMRVTISKLRATTDRSAIALTGKITRRQSVKVAAQLAIEKLAAADMQQVLPAVPLKTDLSGTIDLKGPEKALRATLDLTSAGARIDGHATADLVDSPPIYSASLNLADFDLRRLLQSQTIGGTLAGRITARGKGFALADARGDANLTARNLILDQKSLGNAAIEAHLEQARAQIKTNIAGPEGIVKVSGTAGVSSNPAYDLRVSGERLDLSKATSTAIPTRLNFSGTLTGQGFALTAMDTRVTMQLTNSMVANTTVNRGNIDVQIVRGQANIRRGDFALEGATLDVHGVSGLAPGKVSNLTYRVRAPSIAQFLKLAQMQGNGRLAVDGTVSGPQDRLRTSGEIQVAALDTAGIELRKGSIDYDIAMRPGSALAVKIKSQLTQINAGVGFKSATLDVDAPDLMRRPIAIRLDASDQHGMKDHVAVTVDYRRDQIVGTLREASFGLPDGVWRLDRAVNFKLVSQTFSLTSLRLENRARMLEIGGTIGARGRQDFNVSAKNVDLRLFESLMASRYDLAGAISLTLKVTGTAVAPVIALSTQASRIVVNQQPIGNLSGLADYADREARLDFTLREQGNALNAAGTIAGDVSWSDGAKVKADAMDIRVTAHRLDLARVLAVMPQTIRDGEGVAAIDLRVQGPIERPEANGNLRFAGVKGQIVPLGVKIDEAHGRIDIDPQQVRITSFSAQAGSGSLDMAGAIAIRNYTPGAVQIKATFDKWPAIATQEYNAVIAGEVTAFGTLEQPHLGGNVQVLYGTLRPDLAFLTASSDLAEDDTITVIRPGESAPQPGVETVAAQPSGFQFDRLAIDLAVRINRDTWIKHEQAAVELEGHLRIEKAPQGPLRIVGEIDTVRGWIIYQQRRFDLQSGTISFTGGRQIDPSLDVDARYTLPDYTIDILVTGTASKPTLSLKSQPELAQADILSLILFGKTTSALGQGEQQSLQERAARMAGGYAATQVGQAISQSLGLQDLGIQIGGVGSSGNGIGFGRYIAPNTYVSASEDIGGTQGRKVSLQYFILRWLSITTSTSSNGGSEIDLNLRKQY